MTSLKLDLLSEVGTGLLMHWTDFGAITREGLNFTNNID